jgi:hypothetical protein
VYASGSTDMPRTQNDITMPQVGDRGHVALATTTSACAPDEPRQSEEAPYATYRSPEELMAWMLEEEEPESYLSWTPTPMPRRCPGAVRGVRGSGSVRSGLRTRSAFAWPFKKSRRPTF